MSIGGFTPEFNEILLTFPKSTSRTIARIDDWIFKTVLIDKANFSFYLAHLFYMFNVSCFSNLCFSFYENDGPNFIRVQSASLKRFAIPVFFLLPLSTRPINSYPWIFPFCRFASPLLMTSACPPKRRTRWAFLDDGWSCESLPRSTRYGPPCNATSRPRTPSPLRSSKRAMMLWFEEKEN